MWLIAGAFIAAGAALLLPEVGYRLGPLLQAAALVLLAGCCAWVVWRDALLRHAHAPIEVLLRQDGGIEITRRDGSPVRGSVLPGGLVLPLLAAIRYHSENSRWPRTLRVMSDSVSDDEFRRLCVWLRWRKPDGAEGGGWV